MTLFYDGKLGGPARAKIVSAGWNLNVKFAGDKTNFVFAVISH